MGDRRCCCFDCVEYTDSFDRSDSDDTTYWNEFSGEWAIHSSQLHESGHAGSIALYDTPLPTQWGKATVYIIDEQVGDIYKVYVSWLDSNNHVYGMYEMLSAIKFRISLHSVLAGVDTEIDSVEEQYLEPSVSSRGFSVCNGELLASVSLDDSSLCVIYAGGIDVDEEAKYAGVGHENSHESKFNDWWESEVSYTKLDENGNLACPCFDHTCLCEDKALDHELHGVYEGEGDCDNLDGIEFTIGRASQCGAGNKYYGVQSGGTCIDLTYYELPCASGDVSNWILHISSLLAPHGCGYVGDAYLTPEPESTCDPLYLVYCIDAENATGLPSCGDCLPCGQAGGADCGMEGQPPCPRVTYCITITE